MKYTLKEIQIILFAMDTSDKKNHEGKFFPRTFPIAQAFDISQISKQISVHSNEEGIIAGEEFEMDFSTSEKKLILDCISREWTRLDLPIYLTLHEKLEGKVKETEGINDESKSKK